MPTGPGTVGTGAELVEEIIFDINASGSFYQLMQFVELLSKDDKVIRTRNFTIEKKSTNIDDNSVNFKGEIVGYKQVAVVSPVKTGQEGK